MKKSILGCALALVALSANAKDKLITLSAADAAMLQGKTVALTVHERPSFVAMTAGKAGLGVLGVAAMTSAGNKLVDENNIQDPAEIIRANLVAGLQEAYGAQVLPVDTALTKAKKPKAIAATHPEADYVLDVRSGGWSYGYFAANWGSYWVGYGVQVQLVDTKTGKQVSNAGCNANTQENPNPPSREQLHADGATLLKDVTAALGWMCVQLLAKEQFHFPADKVAATPAAYVDPLAALAAVSAAPAVETQAAGETETQAAAAPSSEAPEMESGPDGAAPAAEETPAPTTETAK